MRSWGLTTPLGISITGAAIDNFENDWWSITNISDGVVATIGVCVDELETFSTG
jgi:hypothetical protein